MLLVLAAYGAVIPVDVNGAQHRTLQSAIDVAQDGDTIEVAPGAYNGCVDWHDRDLTVIGTGGAAATTLWAPVSCPAGLQIRGASGLLTGFSLGFDTSSGIDLGRVLHISASSLVVEDVIVRGAGDPTRRGGGVLVEESTVTFRQVQVGFSSELEGGGLYLGPGAEVEVSESEFQHNYAERGGAIFVEPGATLTMARSRMHSNEASSGGALWVGAGASALLADSWVDGNRAAETGGAVYLDSAASIVSRSNRWFDNAAVGPGGVLISVGAGDLSFDGDRMYGNAAESGGVVAMQDGSLRVSSSGLGLNAASGDGGAVWATGSTVELVTTALDANTAGHDGGALHLQQSTLLLADSALVRNAAIGAGGGASLVSVTGTVDGGRVSANEAVFGGAITLGRGSTLDLLGPVFDLNAANDLGGALYVGADDVLTGEAVVLYGNEASSGGGVYAEPGGELRLVGLVASLNIAGEQGGALCLGGGVAEVSDSWFESNRASSGGAAAWLGLNADEPHTVTLSRNRWEQNLARFDGGAILAEGNTDLMMTGSEFEGNEAIEGGGALALRSAGSVMVNASWFCNNRAENGGAVDDIPAGDAGASWSNNQFIRNQARLLGGAIRLTGANDRMFSNNSWVGNGAVSDGGALWVEGSDEVVLVNELLAYNEGAHAVSLDSDSASSASLRYIAWYNTSDPAGVDLDPEGGWLTVEPGLVAYDQSSPCDAQDLQLSADSALVDEGAPDLLDRDGTRSDVGAYGGPGEPWTPLPDYVGSWDLPGDDTGAPTDPDSDGDSLSDSFEEVFGTDPDQADTDGDGLDDGDELRRGTHPLQADTDQGGRSDGAEVVGETNPLDASDDFPPEPGEDAAGCGCALTTGASGASTGIVVGLGLLLLRRRRA